MRSFARQTAIVGIGATEFSKNSGRSELQLAGEAVLAAIADAGLQPSDVDGLTTFTMETNSEIEVQDRLRRRRCLRDSPAGSDRGRDRGR